MPQRGQQVVGDRQGQRGTGVERQGHIVRAHRGGQVRCRLHKHSDQRVFRPHMEVRVGVQRPGYVRGAHLHGNLHSPVAKLLEEDGARVTSHQPISLKHVRDVPGAHVLDNLACSSPQLLEQGLPQCLQLVQPPDLRKGTKHVLAAHGLHVDLAPMYSAHNRRAEIDPHGGERLQDPCHVLGVHHGRHCHSPLSNRCHHVRLGYQTHGGISMNNAGEIRGAQCSSQPLHTLTQLLQHILVHLGR
mmetsp:Transcript_7624/g.19572  ORF Transcript_7624/g.19572 Transcript_7624/m.19572 type:complete len:244 (+) Transcript_7624:881-1612(+)